MKDLLLCVHFVVKTFNLTISRGHLADYVKELYFQVRAARAARLFSIRSLFSGVVDDFAIIPSSMNSTMLVKHATTGPQGAATFEQIHRIAIVCLHCRQNRECSNFTFLFCKG